jgi:hypothetical protein
MFDISRIRSIVAPPKPVVTADLDAAAYIWHDGSDTESGEKVTAATLTLTVASGHDLITCTCTKDGSSAGDSRIGASGVMDVVSASYDTWGEVADVINAAKGWHCVLVGARRSNVTGISGNGLTALGATNCFKVPVAVTMDNSDVLWLGAGIVNVGMSKTNELYVPYIYYFEGTHTTGAGRIDIVDCNDAAKTDVVVGQVVTATATLRKYPDSGGGAHPFFVAAPGHRICVQHAGSTAGIAGAADFIAVVGGLYRIS